MENSRFKFRIYDLEQKHYLRVIQDETTGAEGFAAFYGEYNNICKSMSFFLCHNIDRWVIEQCTGLKDKNGNLIYEGDIIKDEFYRRFTIVWSEEDCAFEGRVIYRDPEYSDRFDLYKGATDNCEIIGNIHEQAEQKDVK